MVLFVGPPDGLAQLAASSPPSSGLVGWWKGDGNANDSSGHGHDGTLLSGAAYSPGLFGQAFSIGPGPNRIFVADSDDFKLTNGLSIGAWVYPKGNGWVVLQRSSFSFVPYALNMDFAGNIGLWLTSSSVVGDHLNTPIVYNTWTQVTATWDSVTGKMRIYLNGVLAAEKSTTVQPSADIDESNQPGLGIGNEPSGNFPFNGMIEDVVLYSRALSAAEIMSLAGGPPSITTQPQSQNAYYGSTVTLAVVATGGPLNYLWYKDGLPMLSATNSSLVLSNVSSVDQGTYAVVVSNPYDVVASTAAQVTVSKLSSAIGLYPGITIGGITGSTVAIQYTLDVGATTNWTTLTNLTLSNDLQFWLDTSANINSGSAPRRFYRVVAGP